MLEHSSSLLYGALGSPSWIPSLAGQGWHLFVQNAEAVAAFCQPYVERSAFMAPHFVPLQAKVDGLAGTVGLDAVVVRFLLFMLLSYPLAFIMAKLPGATLKHIFSLAVGAAAAQFIYGYQWAHPIIQAGVAYLLLIITAPFAGALGIARPVLVFAWMLGYLALQHLWRLHVDYLGWTLDITGSTMILTIKISALAFNLFDGSKRMRSFYEAKIKEGHKASRIYQDRLDRSIAAIPGFFEYWGYVFCFTSFFAGPAFEIGEYLKGCAGNHGVTNDQAASQANSSAVANKDDHWGSRLKATFGKLGAAILFLAINGALSAKFNLNAVLDPSRKNPMALMNYPFLTRLGIAMLCLFVVRTKYYAVWLLSEGAANLTGFGFKVHKGKAPDAKPVVAWDGVSSIDPIGFETSSSITDATKAWNIQTQSWLQRYCHTRVSQSFNLIATYSLSAFWHGFYPGYYVSFASAALVTAVEKEFKAKVTPRILAINSTVLSGVYDLLCRLVVFLTMNYSIMPFVALSFDAGIYALACFHFAGHIAAVVLLVLLKLVPKARPAAGVAPTAAAGAAAAVAAAKGGKAQ